MDTATAPAARTQKRRKRKSFAEYREQRAAELRSIAVHEAGHTVACLAQGIPVNIIWVKGVTKDADIRVRTFPVDDDFDFDISDGLCDNDADKQPDPWNHLVVDVAGEAAERLDQNLSADSWFESSRSGGDIAFAHENAAAVLAQRGKDATDDGAIADVIEDGYAAAFNLLTRHRDVLEQITSAVLTVGLVTGEEVQHIWDAHQVATESVAAIEQGATA